MSVIAGIESKVDQYVSEYFSIAKFRAAYAMNVPTLLEKDQWMKVDPGFKMYSPVLTRPAGRPRKNRTRASAEGGAPIRRRKCKCSGTPGHIARLCKNPVDPAFGMEDQVGAANAGENEAAIQHEEIETMNRELLEMMDRELLEPMDREQIEQMNQELLEPMDREQREQMD
jgi:hypothetical protein